MARASTTNGPRGTGRPGAYERTSSRGSGAGRGDPVVREERRAEGARDGERVRRVVAVVVRDEDAERSPGRDEVGPERAHASRSRASGPMPASTTRRSPSDSTTRQLPLEPLPRTKTRTTGPMVIATAARVSTRAHPSGRRSLGAAVVEWL